MKWFTNEEILEGNILQLPEGMFHDAPAIERNGVNLRDQFDYVYSDFNGNNAAYIAKFRKSYAVVGYVAHDGKVSLLAQMASKVLHPRIVCDDRQ